MKKIIFFSMLTFSSYIEGAESTLLKKLSIGDCVDIKQSSSSIYIPGQSVSGSSNFSYTFGTYSEVLHDSFVIDVYKGSNGKCLVEFNKEILFKKKKITEIGVDFVEIEGKQLIPAGKISAINPHEWKKYSAIKIKEKRVENEWKRQFPKREEEILEVSKQNDDDGQNPQFIEALILLHLVK